MDSNLIDKFVIIEDSELAEIDGGIAPLLLFCYGFGAGVAGTAGVVKAINEIANLKW